MLIHKNHVSGNGSTNDIYLMLSLVSFYLTQLLFVHINPGVSRFQCFYSQSRSLLGKIMHEIDWNWVQNVNSTWTLKVHFYKWPISLHNKLLNL